MISYFNQFPRRIILLMIIFAMLQAAVAFLTHGQSLTHEETMWQYIGHNWLQRGLPPYEGGVDNKSPLIFLVFGVSDHLFGLNYWFPRLLGLAFQLTGMLFLYRLAQRLAGRQAALITLIIYGLSLMWRMTGGKLVSFTETYAVTFIIVTVYLFMKAQSTGDKAQGVSSSKLTAPSSQLILSGVMAGLALGWRITAVFAIAAVLLYALFKNRSAIWPFLAGIFISISVLLLLAMAMGINLHDMYVYGLADNFGAGSTTDHAAPWRWERFSESFIFSELLLFYPAVIAYVWMPRRNGLLTCWLVLELAGIALVGIYARPHFKQLLPALSIINGVAISYFISRYTLPLKYALGMIAVAFLPKITEPFTAFKVMMNGSPPALPDYCSMPHLKPTEQAEMNLGSWIRENTRKDDKVLVAGFGARVHAYSGRQSPSIYFNVTQTDRALQRFNQDIENNKPDLILIPVFNGYKDYVREDLRMYIDEVARREYVDAGCLYGYKIYKRIAD